MSDRKLAKTVYGKFRRAIACSPSESRCIVDHIVEAIQAERERCAKRVETKAWPVGCTHRNQTIQDAAEAVRNA